MKHATKLLLALAAILYLSSDSLGCVAKILIWATAWYFIGGGRQSLYLFANTAKRDYM